MVLNSPLADFSSVLDQKLKSTSLIWLLVPSPTLLHHVAATAGLVGRPRAGREGILQIGYETQRELCREVYHQLVLDQGYFPPPSINLQS